MKNLLAKYDAACKALAAARAVDEVKDIRDVAIAMAAYARQAKNNELEADAFEIRVRAERRLGDMMAEQKKTVGLAKSQQSASGFQKNPLGPPTLQEAGIDKNLADRSRRLSAMSESEFENMVTEGRSEVQRSVERTTNSKIARKEKHQKIAATAAAAGATAPVGPFPLIYADPPWQWGHFDVEGLQSEKGKGRTPDQHYPTLTFEQLEDFKIGAKLVGHVAHRDAALFLWCTSSNILGAIDVMESWGFEYKTQLVWVKTKADGVSPIPGMGLVFKNCHELVLYGTRGNIPGPQWQPPSVFMSPRGEHSVKPVEVRKAIERMYPDFGQKQRLELFARGEVKGWTTYGLEAVK